MRFALLRSPRAAPARSHGTPLVPLRGEAHAVPAPSEGIPPTPRSVERPPAPYLQIRAMKNTFLLRKILIPLHFVELTATSQRMHDY